MSSKTKRTYNLPTQTVTQVRELVGQYGTLSQDAVREFQVTIKVGFKIER